MQKDSALRLSGRNINRPLIPYGVDEIGVSYSRERAFGAEWKG